jgi:hypothetical protein
VPDQAQEGAALSDERPHTFLCLVPADHPAVLEGPVWKVDVTSAFGPPIDKEVELTKGLFWGGGLSALDESGTSDPRFKITSTDERNHELHVRAFSTLNGTVAVDLVARAGETDPTQGTVVLEPYLGQTKTFSIVSAQVCPAGEISHPAP